jgi:uncharacterized protein YndB with AHSA1/START domain
VLITCSTLLACKDLFFRPKVYIAHLTQYRDTKQLIMAEKQKIELEFTVKSSVKILYKCLSTSSGLSEWFADDVTIKKDQAKFEWDGSVEEAVILSKKTDQFIRYQMLDDEGTDYYFEFSIKTDPLTGDVGLFITDFAEEDEVDEQSRLWESQIGELRHILGG